MTSALKACPFCGGGAEFFYEKVGHYRYRVRCKNHECGAQASNGTAYANNDYNAQKWNTRVSSGESLEGLLKDCDIEAANNSVRYWAVQDEKDAEFPAHVSALYFFVRRVLKNREALGGGNG